MKSEVKYMGELYLDKIDRYLIEGSRNRHRFNRTSEDGLGHEGPMPEQVSLEDVLLSSPVGREGRPERRAA
jgi:hypothetical protein